LLAIVATNGITLAVSMSDQMFERYAKNESLEWVCAGCNIIRQLLHKH